MCVRAPFSVEFHNNMFELMMLISCVYVHCKGFNADRNVKKMRFVFADLCLVVLFLFHSMR